MPPPNLRPQLATCAYRVPPNQGCLHCNIARPHPSRNSSACATHADHSGNNSGKDSGNIGNAAHLHTPHPLLPYQRRFPIENQNSGKNGKQKSGNISGNNSGNASRLPSAPNISRTGRRRLPTGNNSGKDSGNKIGNAHYRHSLASPQSAQILS
ncbi:MAG: hypothetical protein ACXVCX_12795 [Ktedonobacterales bacterium]